VPVVETQLKALFDIEQGECIKIFAKIGFNCPQLLDAIVQR
jgi:translation elongation factor EF-4